MDEARRIEKAKVALLYRCCRRGFSRGRLDRRTDQLLWTLRAHLELPPTLAASVVSAARRRSRTQPRQAPPDGRGAWILRRAYRAVEHFQLQGTPLEGELGFLRASLAAPELAEGSILDGASMPATRPRPSAPPRPGASTLALARLEDEAPPVPRREWRPGRVLRGVALGIALALGMSGLGPAVARTLEAASPAADVRGYQRMLTDLLGREAVGGEDHAATILATYQDLYAACPDAATRRQVREEWLAYCRVRGR